MSFEQQTLQQDNIRENYFHDLILENHDIQQDLLSALQLPTDLRLLNLIHEDRYINGIIVDFTLVYNNQIQALIEVKAADIGVTDYVRGIGQVLQYEHFFEQNVARHFSYSSNFKSVLLIPSSIFQNNLFNIALFKYPRTTKIIEINDINKAVRVVTQKELEQFKEVGQTNITSISQYYVRDTRLFEIYMLLRYLCVLKLRGAKEVNRVDIENIMRQTNSINNRNWRNVWISLSSFGLIDSNNMPTKKGSEYGYLEIHEFLYEMYMSYVKPYVHILMNYFVDNPNNLSKSLAEIKEDFLYQFQGQEILYLTQSETRYLSSWLNILRDDFGCIDFKPRSNQRVLNYNPASLNKEFVLENIAKYSKSQDYIKNLREIL